MSEEILNNRRIFQQSCIDWFENNGRTFPWRETQDPYKILVSEILLQRTKAKQALPVYVSVINKYPDVDSLFQAKVDHIKKIIQPIGLVRRANRLIALSEQVIDLHCGKIPATKKELKNLEGVGDYTAHAVLSFAYNKPYPIVDSNVIRILNRYFNLNYSKPRPNKRIMYIANELMVKEKIEEYNYGVLDMSAAHCHPNKPRCKNCPLSKSCLYAS